MEDKTRNVVVSITFVVTIIVLLILNFLKEDTVISLTERRKLVSFPKLSIDNLLDKSFMDNFDKYTMDQFVKRDEFRKLKTFAELDIFKKKDVNQIYLYKGSLIKQEYPLNEKAILNFTKKINEIKDSYLNDTNSIYYSIVPDKNYYLENDYLKMDYSELENLLSSQLNDMQYINIFDCLDIDDYYYTDTHWKQENLQNVLDRFSVEMKFKDRIKTNFIQEEILSEFKGVYSGQLQVETNSDKINILTNNIIENCKVYNYETKKIMPIYNLLKINSADKYDIFLSGATSLLKISNPNAQTDKELIVFRDSFGSSLIPLFVEGYKTITLIDTRYIASKYLSSYVNFENKDVLFLYSTLVINNSYTLK